MPTNEHCWETNSGCAVLAIYSYEGYSVFLSLHCQSKTYNTDLRRMYYISPNTSPWWCVFIGHKLHFGIFLVYPSYTEVQQIWSYIDILITCLKELLVTLEIIRTQRMQDIVSVWYVAARKICGVVDSKVKNWSCALFYKICNLTFYVFHTILLSFWQHLRSWIIISILINRK